MRRRSTESAIGAKSGRTEAPQQKPRTTQRGGNRATFGELVGGFVPEAQNGIDESPDSPPGSARTIEALIARRPERRPLPRRRRDVPSNSEGGRESSIAIQPERGARSCAGRIGENSLHATRLRPFALPLRVECRSLQPKIGVGLTVGSIPKEDSSNLPNHDGDATVIPNFE